MKVYINGGPYDGQIYEVPEDRVEMEFVIPPTTLTAGEISPGDEVVVCAPVTFDRVVRDIRHRYVSSTDTRVFKGTVCDDYTLGVMRDTVRKVLFRRAPLVHRYQIRHTFRPYPYKRNTTELVVEGIATWPEVTWDDL